MQKLFYKKTTAIQLVCCSKQKVVCGRFRKNRVFSRTISFVSRNNMPMTFPIKNRIISCIAALLLLSCPSLGFAQIEHVPVANPVYDFLMHAEARGLLPRSFSSVSFPLQRKEIIAALQEIRKRDTDSINFGTNLSNAERSTLAGFEREFRIMPASRAVLFFSPSDSTQILFERLFGTDEKFMTFYTDSAHTTNVSVQPLLSFDGRGQISTLPGGQTFPESGLFATYGGRIFGTITNTLGFFLQATSGARFAGSREFFLQDPQFRKNPTFRLYNPNFVNTAEASVRYDNDWFYAAIGRETRLIGSGYFTRGIFSDNPIPASAMMLGARFQGFEYRTMHFALIAEPLDLNGNINPMSFGAETVVTPKFMAFHRAALRESWGEIGVWESVIYSGRGIEFAYLTPFSFLKTNSDDLRDRDNATLGVDATVRPFRGLQLKGTFTLDDIDFGKIGQNWWQNKIAWNLGVMASPAGLPLDATLEYAMVTPYTYTHFDRQNAFTQDGILFAGTLPPNSDEWKAQLRWFWGGRYPLALTATYRRHGANTYDAQGNLLKNVGADVLQTIRRDRYFQPTDPTTVTFLDGDRQDRIILTLSGGFEIVRQWNMQALYRFSTLNDAAPTHFVGVVLRFEDF
jgi:hypothetical protein